MKRTLIGATVALGSSRWGGRPSSRWDDRGDASAARSFGNCTAMNRVYPRGVGKPGARDSTSGTPVTNFKRSRSIYNANQGRDRDRDGDGDGDGIVCEKK